MPAVRVDATFHHAKGYVELGVQEGLEIPRTFKLPLVTLKLLTAQLLTHEAAAQSRPVLNGKQLPIAPS